MRAGRAVLVAALVALVALASAGSARGQDSDAVPAVGGGSYNDAPLLAPGHYTDTIRAGERLFYGFTLRPGEALHVRALVPGDGGTLEAGGSRVESRMTLAVGTETPLREIQLFGVAEDLAGNGMQTDRSDTPIEFVTKPVGTFTASADSGTDYEGPGTYFLSLALTTFYDDPPPLELPLDFDVEVTGSVVDEPRPDATPAPAPRAGASGAAGDGSSRGGTWAAGVALAALVGVLVGVAVAVAARARRSPA